MEEVLTSLLTSFSSISTSFSSFTNPLPEFQLFSALHKSFQSFSSSGLHKSGNQTLGLLTLESLHSYIKLLESITSQISHKPTKAQKFEIIIAVRKISFLVDCVPRAFNVDKQDLSCLDESHERCLALKSITTTVHVKHPKLYSLQLKKFFKLFTLMKAVVYKISQYKESASRDLLTGWLLVYYSTFARKKVKTLARLFDSEGDIHMMKMFWEIGESKVMRKLTSLNFASVNYTKVIFVPRLTSPILETQQEVRLSNLASNEVTSQIPRKENYKVAQDPGDNYVAIRIISAIPLVQLSPEYGKLSPTPPKPEKIIFHVHGGAFVSLSSYSHQNYTRRWANEIPVPIFSIDYRLAPQHPFPEGLDDLWQAYTWLVKYSEKLLGVSNKKIILTGDSAGGNLIIGLTIKAITTGFRVPDGLLLIYPGVNLDTDNFSKGALISLEDKVLPFGFYYAISNAYSGKKYPLSDPLISPINCTQEVLSKFPRTEIIVTEKDPIGFDCIRFADHLLKAGVNTHITAFPDFVHGAISLSEETVVPEFGQLFESSCDLLRSLLDI